MAALFRRRAMTRPAERFSGLEGVTLALSGVLFVAKAAFDLRVGAPPAGAAELVAWRSAEKLPLAMTNEILFVAVVLLVPGVIGLYASLAAVDPRKARWGCGLIAVTIPMMMTLTIVHGRLPYPVYNIDLADPAVAQLVVSLYYGGQHAVALLFSVATILVAAAMRKSRYGTPIVLLGFATGIADVVGAYPWLTGTGPTTASEVLFAAWFIAVGIRLATADLSRAASLTVQTAGSGSDTGP
jgi:hypothetical protein